MREIKLRIRLKHKKDGSTAYFTNSVFDKRNGIAFFHINQDEWDVVAADEYTGLKDKNGKEIYEGDLLRLSSEYRGAFEIPQIVIFEDAKFKYQSTTYSGHKSDISQSLVSDHEIIGNIYENPELINNE